MTSTTIGNVKNHLQEYFQRNHLKLPHYISWQTPDLLWYSKVNIYYSLIDVAKSFELTTGYSSKREAEKAIAMMAFEDIQKNIEHIEQKKQQISHQLPLPSSQATLILVDLESIPQLYQHPLSLPPEYEIQGFLSHHCALASTLSQSQLPFQVHVIESAVADAADHFLTFTVGQIIGANAPPYPHFYIVSRDHAAEATVMCLRHLGCNATHCPSVASLEKACNLN